MLNLFPVEINKADYMTLLRVPGIGLKSAKNIIAARKVKLINFDDLKKIGIVVKRAKYFITCQGKFCGESSMNQEMIRLQLIDKKTEDNNDIIKPKQLSLFEVLDDFKIFDSLNNNEAGWLI